MQNQKSSKTSIHARRGGALYIRMHAYQPAHSTYFGFISNFTGVSANSDKPLNYFWRDIMRCKYI